MICNYKNNTCTLCICHHTIRYDTINYSVLNEVFILAEIFWNTTAYLTEPVIATLSDQHRVNNVLKSMHMKVHKVYKTAGWEGKCSNGLLVSILQRSVICRDPQCSKKKTNRHYYIFHETGGIQTAKRAGVWFLRSDWKEVSEMNDLKGSVWLKSIAA